MKVCPKCGCSAENENAKFCSLCGSSFDEAPTEKASNAKNNGFDFKGVLHKLLEQVKNANKKALVIICGAAIAVIASIICALSCSGDSEVFSALNNIPVSPAEDFRYTSEDGQIIITQYIGDSEKVNIPDMIDGRPVTVIDQEAFCGCIAVTHIVMPDTVTSIGYCAFLECSALEQIKLSEELTSIDSCAFMGCSALEQIKLPEKLTFIGSSAFSECSYLKSITIPPMVEELKPCVFELCTSLESVTLSEGLNRIGNYAFDGCSSLKEIELPNSLTYIEVSVFRDCTSLNSVTIPRNVLSIGSRPFEGCTVTVHAPFESSFYAERLDRYYINEDGNIAVYEISAEIETDGVTWIVTN